MARTGSPSVLASMLALVLGALLATPAQATAGMFCTTGGPKPIEVSLVISRVVAGPLISAGLSDAGTEIANTPAQWWLDRSELRLILIDPDAEREEAVIRARARGDAYVGTLVRAGRSRRVRCEESG